MGQIRARLSTEITIEQAVRDLQRESGDSERHVLALLAEVVEHSEFRKYRISVYAERRDSIKSKRTDTGKIVNATIQRKIAVAFPSLALRLREAARDGWTAHAKQIYADGQPVAVRDLVIEKQALITALEVERVSVPKNWTGTESPAERRHRLAARKKELLAQGKRNFLSIIAAEEDISTERAGALIRSVK